MRTLTQSPPLQGTYTSPIPPLAVPSLVWFAINGLYEHPDQLHNLLHFRLNFRREQIDIDLNNLDPRLWATLVQLYDNLPHKLSTYELPLNDIHLPLLQEIPSTPLFSLLTVLNLASCKSLDDRTISELKSLHSLVALDASDTVLTPTGIQSLANTLLLREIGDEDAQRQHRGPWPLRILNLRNCKKITSDVDLRGTACTRKIELPPGFSSAAPEVFFHPTPLLQSLETLRRINSRLHSSPNAYTLHITELRHRALPTARSPSKGVENAVVTFSSGSNRVTVDNTTAIDRRAQAREDAERHERNKEAWYERHEMTPRPAGPSKPAFPFPPPKPLSKQPPSFHNSFAKSKRPRLAQSKPLPIVSVHSTSVQSTSNSVHRDLQTRKAGLIESASAIEAGAQSRAGDTVNSFNNVDPYEPNRDQQLFLPSVGPGSHFMLYRKPPPWNALDAAIIQMRQRETKRKETMRIAQTMRTADFASVDRTGERANMVKQQIVSMVPRRAQKWQSDFGPISASGSSSKPSTSNKNPFAKRSPPPTETPKKPLVPISTVPTPVFTQELLDVNAKENPEGSLKRSSSSGSTKRQARPRKANEPPQPQSGFDWKKWAKS
ncbi:hypothetical protein CC1G_04253 [Coprinopsis cinerea okayama7|uniref:Uncharacterized protein n=1 Tax=Coprinopsis cinerea (strain Okayama-7 / 130 / ATCC MYA-4618 / FGSC 9003) TaxID=240176 RepID=A8NFG1_COPC7|nr:hypothetical protein CC1G_04253 [Coprinopsis cinerea okayama7\|eukprot:XP_001833274.2 hypothetical protein CC1G_04253 [Coprinopsis cinerea okayama7\